MAGDHSWRTPIGLIAVVSALLLAAGPSAADVGPQAASFPAVDGHRLNASFHPAPTSPSPAPVAILVHDQLRTRTEWQPLLKPLQAAGFAVLALDLRGHGESSTTDSRQRADHGDAELFKEMQHDLRGAYDWVAAQPAVDRARIAVIGAGTGAGVALQYAAADRSVDAVICLGLPEAGCGLDTAGDIHQISGRRVLLLVPLAERAAAYDLRKRGPAAEIEVLEQADAHGAALLEQVDRLPERIAEYAARAVGPPTRSVVYGSINTNIYHLPNSGWIDRIAPTNLRHYSSPQEAEARGLRRSKSSGPRAPRGSDHGAERR